jgi:PKD repeat protein
MSDWYDFPCEARRALHEEVIDIMGHGQRVLGGFAATCVAVATFLGVVAAPASATPDSRSTMRFVSGSGALVDVPLAQTSLGGVTVGASGLDASIDWGQLVTLTTQWDTDAVRQGRAVDPVNTVTRPFAGAVTANWNVGDLALTTPLFPFSLDIGNTGFSTTGACDAKFSGAPYVCHLESVPQAIVDPAGAVGPYLDVQLVADITITPQALATLRTASIGATTVGTSNLSLTETSTTDPLAAACSASAGDHLSYAFGALSSTPGVHVQANLQVDAGNLVSDPITSELVRVPLASASVPFAAVDTTVALHGTGTTTDLGAVQVDDQPVTAVAGGPYAGSEGSPIAFDGSGSTVGCGATLHWTFGDGGSADGPQVQHTFADSGVYSGTLTATKGAQTDTTNFSVIVDNEAPVVDAGPETTTGVGTTVSFTGTATDPSSVDQGSLSYTWEFADGSPTGTATGADVTHTFTLPGVYDVTLTVCDKDGGCNFDTRRVTVGSKQPTVLVNFSDIIGRNGSSSEFRAILVDKDLRPIVGRSITFKLGSQTMTATTDSRGVASTRATVTQRMGLYAVTATFTPGGTDAQQYKGSSMALPFIVLPR